MCWEKRHEDALMGRFTNRQGRIEVLLHEIPDDSDDWEPKKHKHMKKSLGESFLID